MFHKEGYKIIFTAFAICVVLSLFFNSIVENVLVKRIIILTLMIVLVLVLQFFRNPKRTVTPNVSHVLSPVDGKVVVIEEVHEKEYFNDRRIQVSVFMSPLNVHVTRYPVGGSIVYNKYHPGKYLVAWHPKSSDENERTTVVVKNSYFGDILYRQIAGAMAKRIVNYANVGNEVEQAADSGFIKFGSRVDVFLPLGTNINVKINQKVTGGITIIASK
jgi:phosphatidylserine decarboxylase